MNIIIPMAGNGSRFAQAGYQDPKPLIKIYQKPMIQHVVENIGLPGHYIFLVQRAHDQRYNITKFLTSIVPDCTVVLVDGVTAGAACTTLLAREHIDRDQPLLIVNSDQYMEWDRDQCMLDFARPDVDAGILTFRASESKWSYARVNDQGLVTEVAEKQVISPHATVGVYYWRRGSDYVRYAQQMIERNIRVNNEFYVCPVFNEAIQAGLRVVTHEIHRMWGLGTPEDLEYYLQHK